MIRTKKFKNQTAFVCGASKGIGAATAIELSNQGVNTVLLARSKEGLDEVINMLDRSKGQEHQIIIADFKSPKELEKNVSSFLKKFNKNVEILINNTGGPKPGPIINASPSEFINTFNQHLICNHILVNSLVPRMKKASYGRIINIISTSVKQPIKGLGVSNTIRGAVASWSKTLSFELGEFGITVNNVLPGFTDTERLHEIFERKSKISGMDIESIIIEAQTQIPLKRFANPSETAKAICFLASPDADYINGVNLPVDGGRLQTL
ncbi:MAG: short-chain dehydrogenase [Candidatus Marinimicrobia bacterium]|nr:short-chain dehydrogenase [Candidatus Neomarinimicrobiota bacterium]|tara:strand:- start:2916 stop:3713 length:798 start_codon:yes stop_codon:yes gene_type:complete